MEKDVELAIHHAADVAKTRGGRLALVCLRGAGSPPHLEALARAALQRMGIVCDEIRIVSSEGPVRLASVELHAA